MFNEVYVHCLCGKHNLGWTSTRFSKSLEDTISEALNQLPAKEAEALLVFVCNGVDNV